MINLNLSRALFNDAFFPLLTDYSHRWEVYMGSAGSGKSDHIAQKLCIRLARERMSILACRQVAATIEDSVYKQFKDVLQRWKIDKYCRFRVSPFRITFPNGSEVLFKGLDEETKLLSLTGISTVWVEEAFEVTKDTVDQLDLRMRGNGVSNQQIILSFNPISEQHWLHDFIESPPESFVYHHSTYRDNKFLSAEYIQTLEDLRRRNPQKARIYCDGEWGVNTDGLVLRNWRQEAFDASELARSGLEHRCGMDFGYNDPSAIVETFYDRAGRRIYIAKEFYRTGQTLDQLLEGLRSMGLSRARILCDAAEPRTIDFFRRNDISAYPCIKGPNSVQSRILFLQNSEIIVHPDCINVAKELANFSYIKDRKTGKYLDDQHTHEFSHSIDAVGYAYSDIYTRGRVKTFDKAVLGL